ncbi:MAG: ATP-binding protein [Legionellales bacterium]|jgi:PAS domain S-box-containing protein
MEDNEIKQLKSVLFSKYKHILSNQDQLSIEDAVEQIVNYYEDTIKCMPGNVYLFNKDLVPITCNQNVLDMLGYNSTTEFKKKTFEQMGAEGGWSKNAEQSFKKDSLEVIETKQPKLNIEEPPIPNKNGEMIYFLSSRKPVFDRTGEVSGIVGISIDITELKKMSFSLQKALDAAETASAAKTEFIRNMSHDIRTPLSGIIGMANIIDYETPSEGAKDIREAGQALLNLLNEIIETVQLESGDIQHKKECFALRNTIDALVAIYKPAIKQKGLRLEAYYDDDIPKVLYGQELLLHRIILNLLGNAVKFTSEGTISLEVSLTKKNADKVNLKIVISDTGMGIPKDKQESIFDKFSRLSPSYSNNYKGSGLGLYIVKEYIKKLGGDIKVNSTPNKGAQFVCNVQFNIPSEIQLKKYQRLDGEITSSLELGLERALNQTKRKRSNKPEISTIKKSKFEDVGEMLRALVVEDSLLPRKIAEDLLKKEGYQVITAQTAKEAIEKSQATLFDIIYMDVGLPDGTGIEVAKKIRSDSENPNKNTFIAALTAHSDSKITEECLSAGMQEVLDKPLTPEKIIVSETAMNKHQFRFIKDEEKKNIKTEELPIFDFDCVMNLTGNNEQLACDMLNMFIDELPNFRQQITDAFEKQDSTALQHYVHKFHGGLCYSGMLRLKDITKRFEQEIIKKTGDYEANYQELLLGIDIAVKEYNKFNRRV